MSAPMCFGEGNDNLLQDPCLGNPMDRRAWRDHKRVRHDLATKQQPTWSHSPWVSIMALCYLLTTSTIQNESCNQMNWPFNSGGLS